MAPQDAERDSVEGALASLGEALEGCERALDELEQSAGELTHLLRQLRGAEPEPPAVVDVRDEPVVLDLRDPPQDPPVPAPTIQRLRETYGRVRTHVRHRNTSEGY